MPTGIYKRKKAKKRAYTKKAHAAKSAIEPSNIRELTVPVLPAGWEAQVDRRELSSTVRYSIVLQVDVPEVEFDRERSNELAMELGHRLEAKLPANTSLVLVATEVVE